MQQDRAAAKSNPSKLAVALSSFLPADDDAGWAEVVRLDEAYAQVRPQAGPCVEDLLGKVDAEFAGMAPLLQVPPPRVSLVEKYRTAMAAARPRK